MEWTITEPSEGVVVQADATGVWIRQPSKVITDVHQLTSNSPKSRLGRLLPTVMLQLIDMGIAVVQEGGIRIGHQDFARLEEVHGIDAFDGIVPWAPFTVEIDTTRWPGDESFRYFVRFYAGRHIIDPPRLGCFVRYRESIQRIDLQTYSLVEAVQSFNDLPAERKAGKRRLYSFLRDQGPSRRCRGPVGSVHPPRARSRPFLHWIGPNC